MRNSKLKRVRVEFNIHAHIMGHFGDEQISEIKNDI